MQRLLVDSSVYISAFNPNDAFAHQSVDFFRALDPQHVDFLLPRLVMIEVFNILHRHGVRDFRSLERLFTPIEPVDLDGEVQAVAFRILPDVRLKSADLVIVATAKLYEAELITWDRQLIRQATRVVEARTPSERINDGD